LINNMAKMKRRKPSWLLFVGTYPPRECGIATFTRDLANAIQNKFTPSVKSKVLALNDDVTNIYNYPDEVIYQLDETDIGEYIEVAKKINETDSIKTVNIQHEYGIFGGEYGSYLIPFLESVDKPVVTTLHTLLPNPDDKMKRTMQVIAEKSECMVVMTHIAVDILRNEYRIKDANITVIPHGIPSVPYKPSEGEKAKMGFKGKIILSSFGMINPGKGYEQVIKALPPVIEKHPNLLYIIVGETHPVVRRREGESYRNMLEDLVDDLGLEKNVKFYNKYVRLSEIIQYLLATDLYVSSSLNPNQIVSGTLSYAMGCGRAIVSTPFLHAREIVGPERGILVEYGKPRSFTKAILRILSDPELKKGMERNAYAYTRHMTWPNVALSYMDVFKKHVKTPRYERLPKVKLDHLMRLTDEHGINQFAKNISPDRRYGYSIDDNARALIVCCMYYAEYKKAFSLELAETYMRYIEHMQAEDGRFYNFADGNMKANLANFSEDAHGRAMWALGHLSATQSVPERLRIKAQKLFRKGLPQAMKMASPRATAFTLMGLYHYNLARRSDHNVDRIHKLGDHLVSIYYDSRSEDWQWFEPYLTYTNSRLSEALFYAYLPRKRKKYLTVAESTLDFLLSLTFKDRMFHPIGHDGWFIRYGKRAHFDQQPIEASSMVSALTLAYRCTKKRSYRSRAQRVFSWFLGNNHLSQVIYDEKSGGCHDGLGHSAVNLNEGAESTIAYLLARLSMM
jgi:glycosyltransferase involved in cell wall biosynthesis